MYSLSEKKYGDNNRVKYGFCYMIFSCLGLYE